jgi:6-phosphofructokinase 1
VTGPDGRSLVEHLVPADQQERDPHGNIRLAGSDLGQAVEHMIAADVPGVRSRVDTFGYLPRGFLETSDETDASEAFEAGRFAVDIAEEGNGSVALQNDGTQTVFRRLELSAVAGKTRHLPDDFLSTEGSFLGGPCLDYLARLVPRRRAVATPFV